MLSSSFILFRPEEFFICWTLNTGYQTHKINNIYIVKMKNTLNNILFELKDNLTDSTAWNTGETGDIVP